MITGKTMRVERFQHTAARRRLLQSVSHVCAEYRFNTQPPEGGWLPSAAILFIFSSFNTQPPEGGWWLLGWIGRV